MSNLAFKVLEKLEKEQILKSVVLIGSWCIHFYKYYFKSKGYASFIRTHDMDLLVRLPLKVKKKVNMIDLVKDLGFIEEFISPEGHIRLIHPDLMIEFIVPEKGKGSSGTYKIPQLGINAQRLRYVNFLIDNTISINAKGLHIIAPHPAAFVLHKFVILNKRPREKQERDTEGALRVYAALSQRNRQIELRKFFKLMPASWQKKS